ncbi:MAG TPA: phage terminase large subunit [Thermodesulfobacteriota bacterium]|nr:phage terminase large subunit [Thermodesulfobacteriota bacterium]
MGKKSDEFRKYVEEKYKGKKILNEIDNKYITVENIYDLTFEDLDLTDQRTAIRPDVAWAYGVCNHPDLSRATKINAYLFRPNQQKIWTSFVPYIYYEGAYGAGKSLLEVLRAIGLCSMYPGTRVVMIRDTYPNLQRTVLGTMHKVFSHFEWKEGEHYTHNKGEHFFDIKAGTTTSRIMYMPAKNEGETIEQAVKDFGSLEVDAIFIDEARDIDEAIFKALQNRLGRWGKITNPKHRQLMLAGNPAQEDHYLALLFEHGLTSKMEPISNPEDYIFTISSTYENKRNLPEQYIKNLEAMDEYWRDTYLHGKRSFHPPEGEAVYPLFNFERYVAKGPIKYLKGQPILRGWDLGPTGKFKACVVAQRNPGGQLLVLKDYLSDEPGIENFVKNVIEDCQMRFPDTASPLDWADPAAFAGTEMGDMKSPADVMLQLGVGVMKGEKDFSVRKDAVVKLMSKDMYNNLSPMLINPDCRYIIDGFMGGYHYRLIDRNSGRVGSSPVKNKYSHPHDAFQYLCSKLVVTNLSKKKQITKFIKNRNKNLYQRMGRTGRTQPSKGLDKGRE